MTFILVQEISFEELRSYILLRQSQLSSKDKKRIVIEHSGQLSYAKVKSSMRLLGSRFFQDMQNQRNSTRTKTYDANYVDEDLRDNTEEPDIDNAMTAMASLLGQEDNDLDPEFVQAMAAMKDPDAVNIAAFKSELEEFFQETPELHQALVYLSQEQAP